MRPHEETTSKIAIFVSFSGAGGVERMILNLLKGLVDLGVPLDLIPVKMESTHLGALPPSVRVMDLGASHTLSSLPGLIRYLKSERPAAILAAKDRANQTAVMAHYLAGVPTRLVLRMGTTLSGAMAGRSRIKQRFWYLRMRLLYPHADAVVAVSRGVADDLETRAFLPPSLLRVIENPVITPELLTMANEPVDHPWFREKDCSVIIGVGRLTRQKGFMTLVRAFAKVRKSRSCRLVLLGEGRDRPRIEKLTGELGITGDVDLPGFVKNPYAYMSKAAVFALSSAWEGSPNVLTEALALGTPVVATDCPSGPREILENGRYGPLVPIGDPAALADAILSTLDSPIEKTLLKNAVRAYTVEASSKRYLDLLLGKETDAPVSAI
ncbi:MAG: glycosyltransferase [Desulfatiglandaceae bacterium]|jgi:glycosyltransferase involved in cell wall biosynthesis